VATLPLFFAKLAPRSASRRVRAAARVLSGELIDALWPPLCPVCRRAPEGAARDVGTDLLTLCPEHALPALPPAADARTAAGEPPEASVRRCARCALRIASELPVGSLCAGCRRSPPAFRGALVLGDYHAEPGLRGWILALKHGGRRDLAEPLGERLAELARRSAWDEPGLAGSLVLPVPLHPLRRFERGYDQAFLLARAAALAGDAEVVRALRRRRWTPPQGSPGARSRRANVHGAFRLRSRVGRRLAGRRVWLVDDVLTSGATASACAREVRRAGAERVSVLALARVDLRERGEGAVARAGAAGELVGEAPA